MNNSHEEYVRTRVRFAQLCAQRVPEEYDTRYHEALEEFDQFCSHPLVTHVAADLQQELFAFATGLITLQEKVESQTRGPGFFLRSEKPGRRKLIGHFLCLIKEDTYTVENVSDPVDGKAHPHVQGNPGTFCTRWDRFRVALANGALAEAGYFILDALQSHGPGTAFLHISQWPDVQE